MAAVDQRLGVVRRGVTPAAPKPINLPSQKFENHRLIPDVEIVPRGTCCWGSAGKSNPASGKSNDKTDSASLPSGTNGTDDHGSEVQNDSGLTDEQSPAEKSDLERTVESSTLLASSTACVTVAETQNACPNLGVGNSIGKAGSDSPADSDAGSFPESVSRPSSSESYSSSSVTPTARVEEQTHSSGFSQVCLDDYEKTSFQVKQETHVNESPQGSQDFGYFEGFYNTQSPSSRPGGPYPNGMGMAFGHGMHPEPSHHYSCLGVPYYDSVKDKEIVVITMVGNPGVYGNYVPYSGFPDQYGRPSVYGNFPLQFGHFENFVGPQVSAEMNPMCPGEDSGYVCYEQDNYKHGWVNGNSKGTMRRDNSIRFSNSQSTHELHPISDDCSMPKRTGRQKAVNRNRRAALREASPAVFAPERRVTLLTKVSQHEVIISNMQRKSKHGGVRQAKMTSSPHFFAEDVTEVLSASQPASEPNEAISASNGGGVQNQSSASPSTMGQAALVDSSETAIVGDVDDVEESCTLDMSENFSVPESFSLQAAYKGSNGEDSILEPRFDEDAKSGVSELSVTSISTPTATSTPEMTSQAQIGLAAQDQGSPATCSPRVLCQVPASSVETFSVSAHKIRFKPEVNCLSKVGEIQLDCSSDNLTGSAAYMELAREHVNDNGTLSALTAGSLPIEHTGESRKTLAAQKSIKKWKRKGSVDVIQPGHGGSDKKVQDSVVDKRAFLHSIRNDISRHVVHAASTTSIPSSPLKVKPLSEDSVSLSSCAPAALSICDDFAASSNNGSATVSLVDTESDELYINKSREMGVEAGFSTTGGLVPGFCPTLVLDSSMKASSAAGGQTSLSRIVSCGVGKKWRPKLSGAGVHDNSATKVSGAKTVKVAAVPAVSGLQVRENGSVRDCSGSLEVSCENYEDDDYKKQLRVADSSKDLQDEGYSKLINTGSPASKVPCNEYGREKFCPKPSHNVESSEDVQGDVENKSSQTVQKHERSKDLSLTHGITIYFERSINADENEFISRKNSSPKNLSLGKQGHTWRVIGKHIRQQKAPLVSKAEEPEHNSSVVKRKEAVNFVQGASQQTWKPKQPCPSNKGSFDGVKDNPSKLALVTAEGKELGNRRPFSMKNFLNDDNRKAAQLLQSLSYSSIQMEHGMVRENMYTSRIDHGKSHSPSRTYMKLGRRGESHITKKVDRKGWVVKTQSAHSKA